MIIIASISLLKSHFGDKFVCVAGRTLWTWDRLICSLWCPGRKGEYDAIGMISSRCGRWLISVIFLSVVAVA